MSFRLTPASKVSKPSEYKAIFNNGKMIRGKYWQIVASQTGTPNARLGLAISKKVHRLAVERNRFKRIARETFRTHKNALDHREFVVMARHAKPANNAELSKDLINLFNKTTLS